MTTTIDYHQIAQSYITLFQDSTSSFADLLAYYENDLIWQEMPNLFAPEGRSNTLAGLAVSWQKGREAVTDQQYIIRKIVVENNSALIELDWQGTIAQSLGHLAAGTLMRAQVAMVIEFRDGKISRQRDYICYHPLVNAGS